MIVQNLAVQRGQWLSCLSLLLCYLRDGENNLPSTPFEIYTEFKKNVHVPMKPQRLISATTGWEYFAKDYLWTIYQEFCYETQRLIQKKWESANFEQL